MVMMMLLLLFLNLPLLIWSRFVERTSATPVARIHPRDDFPILPAPSKDEWHSPPAGWESTSPGTVLRVRPHAYHRTPRWSATYTDVLQVQFRTTDSHDQPLHAVTTVFIPTTLASCLTTNITTTANVTSPSANCTNVPLLSYHFPLDTSDPDATPSYGLQFSDPYGEVPLALARGWVVSVPDYEGPRAAYGASVLAAHVILDSIRALEQPAALPAVGLPPGRVAMWGYSGGAAATDFAAAMAPSYAPSLHLSGAAVGGLTGNLTRSSAELSGRDVAGLLVQVLLGITVGYPSARAELVAGLKTEGPYTAGEFLSASTMTGADSLVHFAYQNIWEYFAHGEADVYKASMLDVFQREGISGVHGTPRTAMFYYHAIDDDMCPSDIVDAVIAKYCDDGANIVYHRNSIGTHNAEAVNGRQRALDFLGDVLGGTNSTGRPERGCRKVDLTFQHDLTIPFH